MASTRVFNTDRTRRTFEDAPNPCVEDADRINTSTSYSTCCGNKEAGEGAGEAATSGVTVTCGDCANTSGSNSPNKSFARRVSFQFGIVATVANEELEERMFLVDVGDRNVEVVSEMSKATSSVRVEPSRSKDMTLEGASRRLRISIKRDTCANSGTHFSVVKSCSASTAVIKSVAIGAGIVLVVLDAVFSVDFGAVLRHKSVTRW